MNSPARFQTLLPKKIQEKIKKIKTPFDVQEFLFSMPYNAEERDRSPLNVILNQQCHCLDGGFLAAILLWKLGFKPLVLDLVPAPGLDDDHVLHYFRSKDAGARWQNPIFYSLVFVNLYSRIFANWR